MEITQELKNRVDELMAQATELQNQGRFDEADTVIAEAENLEDRWEEEDAE